MINESRGILCCFVDPGQRQHRLGSVFLRPVRNAFAAAHPSHWPSITCPLPLMHTRTVIARRLSIGADTASMRLISPAVPDLRLQP